VTYSWFMGSADKGDDFSFAYNPAYIPDSFWLYQSKDSSNVIRPTDRLLFSAENCSAYPETKYGGDQQVCGDNVIKCGDRGADCGSYPLLKWLWKEKSPYIKGNLYGANNPVEEGRKFVFLPFEQKLSLIPGEGRYVKVRAKGNVRNHTAWAYMVRCPGENPAVAPSPPVPVVTPTPMETPVATPTEPAPPPPTEEKRWTFILHMDGDWNLEGKMNRTLRNLENLVNDNDFMANSHPYLNIVGYFFVDGGLIKIDWAHDKERPTREDLVAVSPSQATLAEVIAKAKQEYPGDYYYLAVADHGHGIGGINKLTPAILSTAIPNKSIDILHLDGCLMGMLEDAYQFRNKASYLISYENLGWGFFAEDKYAKLVNAGIGPKDLAVKIAGEYDGLAGGRGHTVSVVDLGQVTNVSDKFNGLISTLRTDSYTDFSHFWIGEKTGCTTVVRKMTQKLDSQGYGMLNEKDYFLDLYDFAQKAKVNCGGAELGEKADALAGAINQAVIANYAVSGFAAGNVDLSGAHGLSFYFPYTRGSVTARYIKGQIFAFAARSEWDEFLRDYFRYSSSDLSRVGAGGQVKVEMAPMLDPDTGLGTGGRLPAVVSPTPAPVVSFTNWLKLAFGQAITNVTRFLSRLLSL